MTPSASSKIRRFQSLSASLRAAASSSSWVTPTSTHSPRPMAPTTSPSTVTDASLTRCTTARTRCDGSGGPVPGASLRGDPCSAPGADPVGPGSAPGQVAGLHERLADLVEPVLDALAEGVDDVAGELGGPQQL